MLANQSHIMYINVSLVLYGIPEVDDVKGVITLVAATACTWYDERMLWNPSDYGGISKILILMDEVWTPSISLGTPVEFATLGSSRSHVTFFSNGLAYFYPGDVLKSSCTFNMKFWPFDKQVCSTAFFPLDYLLDQVVFNTPNALVNTDFLMPNSEWTLEGTESYIDNSYGFSLARFQLKLKRQSMFYVLTLILPLAGIGALAGLIFILPSESGERMSYAVTITLALAVFLTVVTTEMPKTSEPISLLCVFIFYGVMVSVFGTVVAVLSLAIYHRDEKIQKRAMYVTLVRLSMCKKPNKVDEYDSHTGDENKDRIDDNRNETRKNNYHMNTASMENNISVKTQESEVKENVTWQHVSKAIDKLTILFLIIFGYIPSIIFMIYIASAAEY